MQEFDQRGTGSVLSDPEARDRKTGSNRRSFLKKGMVAGAVISGRCRNHREQPWLQYQELAGNQDNEVSTLASS